MVRVHQGSPFMKVKDAYPLCKKIVNLKFSKLFDHIPFNVKKKGIVGQMLEKYCGLKLSSQLKDFEDGELKTTQGGKRNETTIAITMLRSWIDEIVSEKHTEYKNTPLAKKIDKVILMSVNKDSMEPGEWFFDRCYLLNGTKDTALFIKLNKDYENIVSLIKKSLTEGDSLIHTTPREPHQSLIHIRTKGPGGKKDKPIYSSILKRNVSKSGMAFYYTKKNLYNFLENTK